jgi:hypothetical protein
MILERVTAADHHAPVGSGKTHPSIIVAQKSDSSTLDVVAKFSAGCEEKEVSLAREAVAACLALDLGLPIPRPYIVDIPPGWASGIADASQRERAKASCPVAFGSHLVTGGYSIWHSGNEIDVVMLPSAAAVFVFDLIVQNADRRTENPNCFVRGIEIRIFDHELTFTHGMVLGWKPPWIPGGLEDFKAPGRHVFREGLMKLSIDYAQIREAWVSLSDNRIKAYEAEIPSEWGAAIPSVAKALDLVRVARDNIDACLEEVKRVLS